MACFGAHSCVWQRQDLNLGALPLDSQIQCLIHFMFLWTVHSLCAGLWSESQLAGGASSGGTSWIPWEIVQTLNVGLFADTPLG